MTDPSPVAPLPGWPTDPKAVFFQSSATIYKLLRAKGLPDPAAIGILANGDMESAFHANAVGDHDHSFNVWQDKWDPRGADILAKTGTDLRAERDLGKIVSALWWEMTTKFAPMLNKLLATAGCEDCAEIFCVGFEMAGAANAALRRRMDAARWKVWIADHPADFAV